MSARRGPELLLNNVALIFVEETTVKNNGYLSGDDHTLVRAAKERRSFREKVTRKFSLLRSRSSLPAVYRNDSPPREKLRSASMQGIQIDPAGYSEGRVDAREKTRRLLFVKVKQLTYMPFIRPPPLLNEDPPSSENASDLEDVKQQIDPALLNGSSGNFGSAGARSAPSTPQGVVSSLPGSLSDTQSSVYHYTCSIQRSPSHNIFTKNDKGNIKQLSCSTPVMTAQAQSPEPPSPKGPVKESKRPTTSKARQKKFNRHFPAAYEDVVLNYYSCALISDILLQGHLYITRNYFAFYSNVFGYVTKLLIPMASVQKISKEKTARIIPNAVGITTIEDKHVFGSLMSRDSTYRFMNEVWDRAKEDLCSIIEPVEPSVLASDVSDSSETREESGRESATSELTSRFRKCVKPPEGFATNLLPSESIPEKMNDPSTIFKESYYKLATASRQSLLLFATTFILIMLFLSAAVLLYRIGKVQTRYSEAIQNNFVLPENEDVYGELLQWQTHLHSKSAGAVHSFLDSNLDQIAKVRQSLEALSTLLIPNGHSASQSAATKPIDSSENS